MSATAAARREAREPSGGAARAPRLDRFELGALAALAAVSLAVLVPLVTRGRSLSGSDGLYPADQLQYFAWIREASHHVLIGNRFDLAPGGRPFLHPGFLVSAALSKLPGVSLPVSYLLWKPVAVAVTFAGALAYVRRLLPPGGRRRAALVIALFAVMPATAVVAWTGWGGKPREYTFDFISGEMWSGQYLWGYLMTSVAVFLLPLVLLAVERCRRAGGRRLWLAAGGAAIVTWFQPWQGATLVAILVAVEAIHYARTRERPPWRVAAVAVAAALPATYYAVLGATDASWKLAAHANGAGSQPEWHWPWWAIALTVLPLAAPALVAYRLPARGWQELAVRVWPLAALAVFLQPGGTFPYHAFQGLALPLAILAVAGVTSLPRWRPRPVLTVALIAVLVVPGFAHKLELARDNVHAAADPYFIAGGEHAALDWLERDRRPGGVLAPSYSGFFVPYATGRETYVGALSWSPHYARRRGLADALFSGRLTGAPARAFVRSTRARFLFADCRGLADLRRQLSGELESVRRFGCATVYVLRPRPETARAAGPPDA